MSSNYIISDLSLEDKDPIQRLGKNSLLQFITLDYLILKSYEALIKRIFPRGPASDRIFKNPYRFDEFQFRNFTAGFEREDMAVGIPDAIKDTGKDKKEVDRDAIKDTGKDKKEADRGAAKDTSEAVGVELTRKHLSERIEAAEGNSIDTVSQVLDKMLPFDVFKIYTVSITLQRLWSFVLVNTRLIYDFKVEQQMAELQRASNSYATLDRPNIEASEYYVETLQAQILERLREANFGTPIVEDVEDILVEVALNCGYLLSGSTDRTELEAEGNFEEEQNEKDLLKLLFIEIPSSKHILSSLLEKSGLESVFDTFDDYLASNIFNMFNSEISNGIVRAWGTLFTDVQPEILDILIGLLPTIRDRFRTSSTKSEEQEVIRKGAISLMETYLEEAILPIRVSDLQDTLDNPSANSALYYFRSLLVIVDQEKGIAPWERDYQSPWDPTPVILGSKSEEARTGRLNYLRLILWLLTEDKELGELFRYALELYKRNDNLKEVLLKDFFEGIAEDKFNELVPSAMFPGMLEASDVLGQGGMLIDMNFNRQQKNKLILQTRLARVGGVEAALKDAKVRWMP